MKNYEALFPTKYNGEFDSPKEHQNEFEFLPPLLYFEELINKIKLANKRIYLATMNFEADHFTQVLFKLLTKRAQDGIDVRVNIDGFFQMVTDGEMHVIPRLRAIDRSFQKFRIRQKYEQINFLRAHGVDLTITNEVVFSVWKKFKPAHGRSHVKLAIIDNDSYIGGVNLSDKDFSRPDFMIRNTNPLITEQLVAIVTSPPLCDVKFSNSGTTSLLYDAGKNGGSLILEKAIALIREAKVEVVLTSQFFPDGILAKTLSQAYKSGVSVTVITSSPKKIFELPAHVFNRINQLKLLLKHGEFPIQYYPGWLHTKLLLVDSNIPNIAKCVAGTHNFSETGVKWKNSEVAFLSSSYEFISSAKLVVDRLLSVINANSNS